ncbi:MAG: FlgD immunoglobulin-like domain containing protein, partial [candidate division WOR-3 bacterium]
YRDFVIVTYSIENRGASPVNGLYAGIFSDFDVNNTTSNRVFSDVSRRLTYMAQASSFANSAGIKLLSPRTAANLSAIDHAVYVTPSGMMTEAVKDSFLCGTISRPNSNRTANWSCVVSAGPFDLGPGQRTRVAFAIVGGSSQAAMLANADSAQSFWDNRMPLGLAYLRGIVDDAAPGGNGDGLINPGETVNLPTWIANRADRSASGVWGTLRRASADTLVTVIDSLRYFGQVGAGDSAFSGNDGFKFRVASSCTNRFRLPLVLVCRDTLDSVFTSTPLLEVAAPQLVHAGTRCWDPLPGGNNNGRLDPGENAELALGLLNCGSVGCQSVTARLKSTDPRLEVLDSIGGYGTVLPESTVFNGADRFRVRAGAGIPPETQIACTLFVTGNGYQVTRVVSIAVGLLTAFDPIPDGPRTPARYYAYDDVDSLYLAHPQYNWVDITGVGTRLTLSDDQTAVVDLPAGFGPWRYYGQNYTQVSICSNGWLAPGSTTSSVYLNSELPGTSAPMLLAANWDDLYPPSGNGVWFWHDTLENRFIVQWDSIPYYNPRNVCEWFEVILFDTTRSGPTGENDILVQYRTANNYGSSTVGMQDDTRTIGIQCLFNGSYHRAAAQLAPGRAVLYSTDSLITGVADAAAGGLPKRLEFRVASNPVRSRAVLRLALPQEGHVRVTVHDVTGRVVRTLADSRLRAGTHVLNWDRRDDTGRSVASGIYICRLETGSGRLSSKTVVLD